MPFRLTVKSVPTSGSPTFNTSDDTHPLRLVEQTVARDDPAPKAVACYGLLARCWDPPAARREELWLRFVDGRPVSAVTIDFLAWCAARAQERGKRAVLVIWDNASWHDSQIVRTWLRQHNRQVKRAGQGVRLHILGLYPTLVSVSTCMLSAPSSRSAAIQSSRSWVQSRQRAERTAG
jgi:hypothetical protein